MSEYLTLSDSREFLERRGFKRSDEWIKKMVQLKKIKSKVIYNSRVIAKAELMRVIFKRPKLKVTLSALLIMFTMFTPTTFASTVQIDLGKIIEIESSGEVEAFNKKSQARGLCQITPVVLLEWNSYHPGEKYELGHLFIESVNLKIADWYLHKRIKQMLAYFEKPITKRNILISYNAGINYVVTGRGIPQETVEYLEKYFGGEA